MRLLEQYQIRATFTAAALSLERAPELTQAIVAGGHEVCSHGWRWVHQFRMEEDEERTLPIRFTPTPTRARMGANRI